MWVNAVNLGPAASCGTCCNKTQCYRLPLCVVLIMICCGLSNRVPHLCSWPIHWHSFLCFHRYPKKLIQTYSVFPNLVRTLTATIAPNNDGYESFFLPRMKWVTWLFSPTIPYWPWRDSLYTRTVWWVHRHLACYSLLSFVVPAEDAGIGPCPCTCSY